jgi:uncharacterized protein with HEPN domain
MKFSPPQNPYEPRSNLSKHIIESIEKIEVETKSRTKRSFENSGIIKDGILYNLQTLSESTQKISRSLKLTESDIPWVEISNFRNKLVHDYLGIDSEIIWNVIKKKLPKLKKRAEKMIEFLEKKSKN